MYSTVVTLSAFPVEIVAPDQVSVLQSQTPTGKGILVRCHMRGNRRHIVDFVLISGRSPEGLPAAILQNATLSAGTSLKADGVNNWPRYCTLLIAKGRFATLDFDNHGRITIRPA